MRIIATASAFAFGLTIGTAAMAQSPTPETPAAPAAAAEGEAQMEQGATTLPNGQSIVAEKFENGRWYNADDIPTYKVEADGTIDYATFSGYRRYSAECHVCHGPDGEGSTYAPALKKSVLRMDYYEFQEIAASGKQEGSLVMPAFGTNKNAWCYIDDIYTYLVARGTDAVPRGRPAKKAEKSPEFTAQEDSCMNG